MVRPYTILFAEDESGMRDLVAQILSVHGFVVLTAADGYEAIRLLTENHVDVLFADIIMPGISGFQLAQQAKLIRPHLKVLYTTGHAYKVPGSELRYGKVLPKPLRPAELVRELRELLAGPG